MVDILSPLEFDRVPERKIPFHEIPARALDFPWDGGETHVNNECSLVVL